MYRKNQARLRAILSLGIVSLAVACSKMDAHRASDHAPNAEAGKPDPSSDSKSAKTLTIATYNVENMWDDNPVNPKEYDDFSAKSNWITNRMYEVKARHVARALELAGSPDVVGLEELEYGDGSGRSLELLWPELQKLGYRYKFFGAQDNSVAVTEALISKYPIVETRSLRFDYLDKAGNNSDSARDPFVVTVDANGTRFDVYVAHWKSMGGEDRDPLAASMGKDMRRQIGNLIFSDIQARKVAIGPALDAVVLGDFNSEYTAPEQRESLHSTGNERWMVSDNADLQNSLYNLWYELEPKQRCGTEFNGVRGCIDNMLLTNGLYDNSGLQYVDNSFRLVGAPGTGADELLGADGAPLRWQTRAIMDEKGKETKQIVHLGIGYSDHLPLVATFRILGKTDDFRKMTLTSPSSEISPNGLFVHVPYCTQPDGTFLSPESVKTVKADTTLSVSDDLGKCIATEELEISLVDVYDGGRKSDYGFRLATGQAPFDFVVLSMQAGDFNTERNLRVNEKMNELRNKIKQGLADKKHVFVKDVRGRLGLDYGKLTLMAEQVPAVELRP